LSKIFKESSSNIQQNNSSFFPFILRDYLSGFLVLTFLARFLAKIFIYVFVKECKKIQPGEGLAAIVSMSFSYNPDLSRRSHPRNPRASFLKENCGFSTREICDRTLGITVARCAVVGKVQKPKCQTMETSWCVIALPNLATMF